jgi:hypothetical protein
MRGIGAVSLIVIVIVIVFDRAVPVTAESDPAALPRWSAAYRRSELREPMSTLIDDIDDAVIIGIITALGPEARPTSGHTRAATDISENH